MQVEVGNILEAKVTGITKFGAFVKFENDQTAMVHISEIAPTYVNDIADHLTVGQVVKVIVLGITPEGKISASIKRALPAPERRPGPRPGGPGRGPKPPARSGPSGGRGRGAQHGGMTSQFPPQSAGFEDMLSKFLQTSDDKMSDMKKNMNVKHQGRHGGRK